MADPSPTSRKRDGDGVTSREREFIRIRREDPTKAAHVVMREAGFKGTDQQLGTRAAQMLRNPRIGPLVYAPMRPSELRDVDDETLKKEIKRRWRSIVLSDRATDSDAIKAGDKLMGTIAGGYVPVQINAKGSIGLEMIVAAMGGAPPDHQPAGQLPAKEDDE